MNYYPIFPKKKKFPIYRVKRWVNILYHKQMIFFHIQYQINKVILTMEVERTKKLKSDPHLQLSHFYIQNNLIKVV